MFTEKMTLDLAQNEICSWLDSKKIVPSKRETYSAQIALLTEHLMFGTIVINEDRTITHTLLFPILDTTGGTHLDQLKYKARLTTFEINQKIKGIKAGDGDGRLMAYKSALTGLSVGELSKLDTSDESIAEAIMLFFT